MHSMPYGTLAVSGGFSDDQVALLAVIRSSSGICVACAIAVIWLILALGAAALLVVFGFVMYGRDEQFMTLAAPIGLCALIALVGYIQFVVSTAMVEFAYVVMDIESNTRLGVSHPVESTARNTADTYEVAVTTPAMHSAAVFSTIRRRASSPVRMLVMALLGAIVAGALVFAFLKFDEKHSRWLLDFIREHLEIPK